MAADNIYGTPTTLNQYKSGEWTEGGGGGEREIEQTINNLDRYKQV